MKSVGGEGELRQHFLDMGVIPGAELELIKFAPMGDPMELRIHGYELTLRLSDAEKIEIVVLENDEELSNSNLSGEKNKEDINDKDLSKKENKVKKEKKVKKEHPGLGEGGRFHIKENENPLSEGTILSFALAGNQNCGKTTLFNQLTGSNQHVGNFPGVTVDQKTGSIINHKDTLVTDLPGIYSLSPYTNEELVSRRFILEEKPTGIINIVDATNIERNLYLTMQLMELDVPIVLAINMMDELRGNGGSIRINEMEEMLGIPVVPISAAKNEGINELISHALHIARYQEKPARKDFCDEKDHNGAVHRCLHAIMHLIEDHALEADIPVRFAATKIIEGDSHVLESLKLTQNEKEMMEHIIIQMEEERGLDRSAAIADMRFSFIKKLAKECVVKGHESKERARSEKIDKILTGKYTAIPCFIVIMALIFYLSFNVIGGYLQGLMEQGIESFINLVGNLFSLWDVNEVLSSLIINGVLLGVGSVLSFLPIIVVLFLFLSLLEDTGYMARVAFVMDKLLRKIGLSGRSIVPMLVGFGCSVPGVMSSRTLPSERDRKMTIMLIPFMSCTAKLPVYGFITNAFFPERSGLIMVGLYFLGIIMGILTALLSKNTKFKGEAIPFVMELPNYRLPGLKNVCQLLWEKAKDFLQKAFTVIFIASIIIWFLQTFNLRITMVNDSSESILAMISGLIAPIFKPLGFGDWRIVTSLITGFIAKESVVSTLTVLVGEGSLITTVISAKAAKALLVFCLLYTPCVATIASIKRELGAKWAVAIVVFQCLVAYVAAFVVNLI